MAAVDQDRRRFAFHRRPARQTAPVSPPCAVTSVNLATCQPQAWGGVDGPAPKGTIHHWRIKPFLCAHVWHVFSVQRDGFEHKMCATCGADLGLVGYCATYSTNTTAA